MIERFADGNMGEVVRVGDIVRKQRMPWLQATGEVLGHLQQAGFMLAPQLVAFDESSTEYSFIPGSTIDASLDASIDLRFLEQLGGTVRNLHDVLAPFRFGNDTRTVTWHPAPIGETIVCHNDLSPWNTVVLEGKLNGFIDWDLVSYGTREWELAWMCWRWAPIYPTGVRTNHAVEKQIQRCRTLLRGYGPDVLDLRDFTSLIEARMDAALEVVERMGGQGVAGFDRLLAAGLHLSGHDDLAWLRAHRNQFTEALNRLNASS